MLAGRLSRCSAIRSTSSTTTTEGCRTSGQPAGRANVIKRRAGQHHHGDAGHLAQQVADGVGLAGARRAVQQYAALEVLAAGPQPRHVPGHPDDLPLDPLEQSGGKITCSRPTWGRCRKLSGSWWRGPKTSPPKPTTCPRNTFRSMPSRHISSMTWRACRRSAHAASTQTSGRRPGSAAPGGTARP